MLKIAISRCLLGEQVRYDGTAKSCNQLSLLKNYNCEIIAFCPEVSIGMGVPRLPIQLDLVAGEILARRKEDISFDYTRALSDYAEEFAKLHSDLIAVINKKSSPSCGYKSTKLYDENELIHQHASGIFIDRLQQLLPEIYIIDEEALSDHVNRQRFEAWLKQKSPAK